MPVVIFAGAAVHTRGGAGLEIPLASLAADEATLGLVAVDPAAVEIAAKDIAPQNALGSLIGIFMAPPGAVNIGVKPGKICAPAGAAPAMPG